MSWDNRSSCRAVHYSETARARGPADGRLAHVPPADRSEARRHRRALEHNPPLPGFLPDGRPEIDVFGESLGCHLVEELVKVVDRYPNRFDDDAPALLPDLDGLIDAERRRRHDRRRNPHRGAIAPFLDLNPHGSPKCIDICLRWGGGQDASTYVDTPPDGG